MPPTRTARYCCEYFKEGGGTGRFVVTGVRWAESAKRKNKRAGLEVNSASKYQISTDPDNPDNAELARICPTKGRHILNPIIDWTDGDIWEFIREYEISYCKLYDKGYKRLGCIGCPMNSRRAEGLENYPKFKQAYLRAFQRMIDKNGYKETSEKWKTAEDMMKWWLES